MSCYPRHLGGPARRGAFTLIELLVVVAVIALLLSIATPTLRRAVALTYTAKCKSNLHQMGVATTSYASANRGYVVRDAGPRVAHYLFAVRFMPYITGEVPQREQDWAYAYEFLRGEETFLCPAIRDQTAPGGREYVLNYVINSVNFESYIARGNYSDHPSDPIVLGALPGRPDEILYIAEFNPGLLGVQNFTTYDIWVPSHMPFNRTAPRPAPRMIHAEDARHGGRTTIIFFDGHVRTRDLDPYDIPTSLWNPKDRRFNP
jgi:prepilin-type N-terminal cleavage/methylation domain-containing protein/prepilin-type processing-associated H-X9-DG protein